MAQSLSNLPIGSKIKFGKYSVNGETAQSIIWLVVSKSTDITLLTEKLIDYRCFDAQEPNNTYEVVGDGGYNRYAYSNLGQWLNSDAAEGQWYTSQHTYDQAPTSEYVGNNTPYAQRPGFLYNFTSSEKNAISTTTVVTARSKWDGSGEDTIYQKVFIPSMEEVTTKWSYFANGGSRICYGTTQANANSTVTPAQTGVACNWWTRNANDSMYEVVYVGSSGDVTADTTNDAYRGWLGVRPALNLLSTLSISDTTDSDGCYTVIWNSAPSTPTTLNVSSTIYSVKSTTVSWGASTDPNGDIITYQLEQSLNGGDYSVVYTGTNLAHTLVIPYGSTSVQFRVKAIDSVGASSTYITSTSRSVINNDAPIISEFDSNIGIRNNEFTVDYIITDINSNAVTITESIDNVRIRSYTIANSVTGVTNTFSVTGTTWLALSNGTHTLTVTATDGIDSVVRTSTFIKSVDSFTIQTTVAKELSMRPIRIKLNIGREIPVGAIFKVEVCNNAFSTNIVWEDATSSVTGGLSHVFANESNEGATKWGVLIRITVERNNTSGACYISSIGGNFE